MRLFARLYRAVMRFAPERFRNAYAEEAAELAATRIRETPGAAYATNRYEDTATGESFDGDHDQRHSFNGYAQLRVSPVTAVSGRLRVGSRVPIPGYLSEDGGVTRLGEIRNNVRLPTYARLDLRANRAFNWESRRLTLFVEVMNVLARTNEGPACPCTGWADVPRVFSDGRVTATTQRMAPFLPTVGFVIDF